jgi:hypothetical protein
MFCCLDCTNVLDSGNNIWKRLWSFAANIIIFWNLKECHEIHMFQTKPQVEMELFRFRIIYLCKTFYSYVGLS